MRLVFLTSSAPSQGQPQFSAFSASYEGPEKQGRNTAPHWPRQRFFVFNSRYPSTPKPINHHPATYYSIFVSESSYLRFTNIFRCLWEWWMFMFIWVWVSLWVFLFRCLWTSVYVYVWLILSVSIFQCMVCLFISCSVWLSVLVPMCDCLSVCPYGSVTFFFCDIL